jgi:hypothetical protein
LRSLSKSSKLLVEEILQTKPLDIVVCSTVFFFTDFFEKDFPSYIYRAVDVDLTKCACSRTTISNRFKKFTEIGKLKYSGKSYSKRREFVFSLN